MTEVTNRKKIKVAIYSLILNNHQANVADELWTLTDHQFCFVELASIHSEHRKGDTRNYDACPYLLRAWESTENRQKAMDLACTSDCCIFSGVQSLPFQKARLKIGLLSFDMSERWLKQGLKNLLSPAISRMFLSYWLRGWNNKPLYKLCCSAFAADDHYTLHMYKDKCYKWGYFTKKLNCSGIEKNTCDGQHSDSIDMMWCSRYLRLKHPELPLLLSKRLKEKGYNFHLDMYGEGPLREKAETYASYLGLKDDITFHNNMSNDNLLREMMQHEIFLLTSDKNEGWGAVANEAMSCGCNLVLADSVGCAPYLINEGVNGQLFQSSKVHCSFGNPDNDALDSLCKTVEMMLDNPEGRLSMRNEALFSINTLWSPSNAAKSLLQLIDDLRKGKDTSIKEGPCSKA